VGEGKKGSQVSEGNKIIIIRDMMISLTKENDNDYLRINVKYKPAYSMIKKMKKQKPLQKGGR